MIFTCTSSQKQTTEDNISATVLWIVFKQYSYFVVRVKFSCFTRRKKFLPVPWIIAITVQELLCTRKNVLFSKQQFTQMEYKLARIRVNGRMGSKRFGQIDKTNEGPIKDAIPRMAKNLATSKYAKIIAHRTGCNISTLFTLSKYVRKLPIRCVYVQLLHYNYVHCTFEEF